MGSTWNISNIQGVNKESTWTPQLPVGECNLQKWGTTAMVIDLVSALLPFHPIHSSTTKALFIVIASCNNKRLKFLMLMQHAWVHLGDIPIPSQPFTYGGIGLVSAVHHILLPNVMYGILTILILSIQVACALPGTQGANLDIAAAYRTLPILPDHRQYLCCQIKGRYYMDHNFPFEACLAHYCLGRVVDAIVDILNAVQISPVLKWGDDLFPIWFLKSSTPQSNGSVSYSYTYDLAFSKDILTPLCVPWHATKWKDFSSKPIYLGLVWDFDKCTVALTELKHIKYLTEVTNFLQKHSTSCVEKKLAMSLLGTLSHITVVHQDSHSYFSALSAFISTFTNEHKPRYPHSSVIKDLEWWSIKLTQTNFARPLSP